MLHSYRIAFITFLTFAISSSAYSQTPGSLDGTFGTEGKVIDKNAVDASALQPDGKILLGSYYLSRYLIDGTLDNSFGKNGNSPSAKLAITGIGVVDEGRILVTGENQDVTLVAFKSNGSIDSSFGTNGTSTTDFKENEHVFGLHVAANKSLILVGGIQEDILSYERGFVVHYLQDGTLDKGFGVNGKTEINEPECFFVSATEQLDGKIIAVGQTRASKWDGVIARLNADGSLDSTFGGTGVIVTNGLTAPGESFNAVSLQKDGKIIASGTSGDNGGSQAQMLAIRYNVDGSIDESFGRQGLALVKFENEASSLAMKLQQDDKIVLAGTEYNISTFLFNGAITRLTKDGIVDSGYGTNGLQSTDFADDDTYRELLLQPDGKAVAAGGTNINNRGTLIMARYFGGPKQLGPLAKKIRRWIRNHTLNWQDVNNNDVSYYSISQSNGISGFKEIARIKAGKNDTYSYNLSNTASNDQTNTYRITAVSHDGSNLISETIRDDNSLSISVSPNPAKNILRISGLPSTQKSNLSIVNRNGNVLASSVAQSSSYNFNVQNLHSGDYYLQVTVNNKTETIKFIKQ